MPEGRGRLGGRPCAVAEVRAGDQTDDGSAARSSGHLVGMGARCTGGSSSKANGSHGWAFTVLSQAARATDLHVVWFAADTRGRTEKLQNGARHVSSIPGRAVSELRPPRRSRSRWPRRDDHQRRREGRPPPRRRSDGTAADDDHRAGPPSARVTSADRLVVQDVLHGGIGGTGPLDQRSIGPVVHLEPRQDLLAPLRPRHHEAAPPTTTASCRLSAWSASPSW